MRKAMLGLGLLAAGAITASAATGYDLEAVTALVDDGTTLFAAVALLTLAIVGFGILVKIAKKVRG